MQDQNDTSTGELPLGVAEGQETPQRAKAFRSKYTEPFLLKCRANRDPSSPSLMLLQALVGCEVPHKSVDVALNMPAGTVQKYLLTGQPVQASEAVTFGDDAALMVFDMLSDLHAASAFKGNDLKVSGVLQAMLAFKLRPDE